MTLTLQLRSFINEKNLAKWGENQVAEVLLKQSWQILCTNYRGIGFELDLIASKGSSLIAVEVKTRKQLPQDFSELIPHRKRKSLQRGLIDFTSKNSISSKIKTSRIDLALVTLTPKPILKYYPNISQDW